jgi:hypothetical protein
MIHDAQSLQIVGVGHRYWPVCHKEDDDAGGPQVYVRNRDSSDDRVGERR